jgi:predicted transposase YbfD/YdcC
VFEQIPDPRDPRGVRHGLADILTIAACAVLSVCATYLAIADWALARGAELEARGIAPPSKDTFRGVLSALDADALDRALGLWARGAAGPVEALAIDGKEARGARNHGERVHLLCAATHGSGMVVGQVSVGAKTNEIPMVRELLDQIGDVKDLVLTLDALHTQRDTAELIVERGAHYALTVKANQPKLLVQVTSLPWEQIPAGATTSERSHGKATTRAIQVCQAPGLVDFPHVPQVARIRRTTTRKGETTTEYAHIVTDLTPAQAGPDRLATLIRAHWTVENAVHWTRDTVWREDDHQAAAGNGPRVMASLRNAANSIIRRLSDCGTVRTTRFLAANHQLTTAITGL